MQNMLIKIILTKSNERIISAIGEMQDPETGNGIGFILKCPYLLSLGRTESEDPSEFSVSFTKWIPYSSDRQFRIPYDSVIAMGEVEPDILSIYIEKFGEFLNDNDTVSTSDSSDSSEGSGVSDSASGGEGGEP